MAINQAFATQPYVSNDASCRWTSEMCFRHCGYYIELRWMGGGSCRCVLLDTFRHEVQ